MKRIKSEVLILDDPIMQLGLRLAEVAAKNTASAISDKLRAIKSNSEKDKTIAEMQEIIYQLLDEKQEIEIIAKSFQDELTAQTIKESDLEFVVNTIIPAVKEFMERSSADQNELEKNLRNIETIEPLLSLSTLTVLQTLGFNYKRAIGEPLTNLVRDLIIGKDKDNQIRLNELITERDIEFYKVTQDENAYNRAMKWRE